MSRGPIGTACGTVGSGTSTRAISKTIWSQFANQGRLAYLEVQSQKPYRPHASLNDMGEQQKPIDCLISTEMKVLLAHRSRRFKSRQKPGLPTPPQKTATPSRLDLIRQAAARLRTA